MDDDQYELDGYYHYNQIMFILYW